MRKGDELSALLSLLDDEDEQVALEAMAQLLAKGDLLGDRLACVQDSSDPLMRRRVHQLAAALTLRRRRSEFSRLLAKPELDVVEVLVALHLQWFDNDSRPEMISRVRAFLEEGRSAGVRDFTGCATYMYHRGFVAERDTTMRPENYCVGLVLYDHFGSGALLTLLCYELLREHLEVSIVRFMGEFALCGNGKLLFPERDWQYMCVSDAGELELWDERKVLKFIGNMLFASAVNTDSFRYVLTIGQALSGLPDDEILSYLPYPYRPAAEGDDEDI